MSRALIRPRTAPLPAAGKPCSENGRTFYLGKDASGNPYIYPGRLVEARVIAVAEKVLRVEAFGIECAIFARDLSWQWVSDVRDLYSVGDRVLVRVAGDQRRGLPSIFPFAPTSAAHSLKPAWTI